MDTLGVLQMNGEDRVSNLKINVQVTVEELSLLDLFTREAVELYGPDFPRLESYVKRRLGEIDSGAAGRIEQGWHLALALGGVYGTS